MFFRSQFLSIMLSVPKLLGKLARRNDVITQCERVAAEQIRLRLKCQNILRQIPRIWCCWQSFSDPQAGNVQRVFRSELTCVSVIVSSKVLVQCRTCGESIQLFMLYDVEKCSWATGVLQVDGMLWWFGAVPGWGCKGACFCELRRHKWRYRFIARTAIMKFV